MVAKVLSEKIDPDSFNGDPLRRAPTLYPKKQCIIQDFPSYENDRGATVISIIEYAKNTDKRLNS